MVYRNKRKRLFQSSGDFHLIGSIWLDAISDSHLWLLAVKGTKLGLHQFTLFQHREFVQQLVGFTLNLQTVNMEFPVSGDEMCGP